MHPALVAAHKAKVLASVRDYDYYLKEYHPKNMTHRTYVVNYFLANSGYSDKVKDKWTVANVKKLNVFKKSRFLCMIIDGSVEQYNRFVLEGMLNLAKEQARLWNLPREAKSNEPVPVPEFNPGSAKQLQEFFTMLDIPAITVSKKTDNASWNRDNIELLSKTADDEDLLVVLQAFIDHSFSGIIRSNFLAAFDSFTIDDVLYGNMKIFGAKSFRPTSNGPNLLNMPSSRSIYAEPLKKCFVAPEGRVIYAVDLGALEDRGIANLSGDVNKQNIFLEDLDGHSLNACGYFKDEIEEIMGPNTDNVAYVKEFYRLVEDEDNKVLKGIRFKSKGPTFKLAYGGYPDDYKGGVITQVIFDNYHNLLYPGITEYREGYVLPFTQEHGYIHLGLGCRMYSDDAENSIRSINNATVQFWSILTLIAVNEINYRIEEAGLQNHIDVISTIYDSIYFTVDSDPEIVKWLNDNIIPVLCVKWLQDEVVCNVAKGEIGNNWHELHKLSNDAPIEEVIKTLALVKDGN
jgi:DNA polymerase-1